MMVGASRIKNIAGARAADAKATELGLRKMCARPEAFFAFRRDARSGSSIARLALRAGALVASAVLLPPAAHAAPFDAIRHRLQSECAAGTFSGEVLVRVHGREAFYLRCGSADAGTRRPITRGTSFRIFSTSKLLTALAVMHLVEQGRMSLGAPITRYVPEAPREWGGVTIKHLLQHTSGLPDQTEALLGAFRDTHAEAMRAVLSKDSDEHMVPATTPGSAWKYNNFGYELLSQAAAQVTGEPFDRVLRDLVLQPAQMRHAVVELAIPTGEGPVSVSDPRLANGYNGLPDHLEPAAPKSFVQLGAGAIHATVDDFVALARALKLGRIISRSTFSGMTGEIWSEAGQKSTRGYGLGVMVRGQYPLLYVGHDGGTNGYLSDFEIYPDHDAMLIVLTNIGFAKIDWIRASVAGSLRQHEQIRHQNNHDRRRHQQT